ncbi:MULTISPECIES: SCO6880 family protein [Streptacidiphilus]|uniref:SCO6880 family protein n=1 Tax=Streptacidiphilus cavernicola TaxID=3342716 RepID=A0ABV6UP20_9ACTN|nr:SCO6880 family protein [Streptacidiphilus jeojiense]
MATRTYQFGKTRPTGLVGRRDLGEQVVVGLGAATGVMLGFAFSGMPVLAGAGLALPILFSLAVVFVPYRPKGTSQRRTVYRWWRIKRYHRRALARSGGVWVSPAVEAGTRADGTQPDSALTTPEGLPGMTWVPVTVRGHKAAVVLQPAAGCVTATLEVASPGLGGKEPSQQVIALERWRELLDAFGNSEEHPVKRIQVLARQIKSDPQAHRRYLAQRDESAATAGAPQWLRDSYSALADAVSTSAEEHRYYVTMHAKFTRDLAADSDARGSGDEGLAAVMAGYLDELWARCEDADMPVIAPLDEARLTALIRNSYDPDHPLWDAELPRAHAFPRNVDVRNGEYLAARAAGSTTSWYHATAAVTSWPTAPVGPDFLAPLLIGMPDVIRTMAITQNLEPTDKAVERMLAEDTNNRAEMLRNQQRGRNVDPRDVIAADATGARGMALAQSGAAGSAVVGYITISARSPEELARTKRTTFSRARGAHLRIEWLDLEHARAFGNTLPFAGGIK